MADGVYRGLCLFRRENPQYPMAQYLADKGNIVVVPDHIGVGDSSRVANPWGATRHITAKANDAFMQQVYRKITTGNLHDSLPVITEYIKVGMGHSMGGMQTITQQALCQTYDRIGVLGFTAAGVHLHFGGMVVSADPGPIDPDNEPPYWTLDRSLVRTSFHWDDVPDDVIDVDDQMLVEVPTVISRQSTMGGIVTGDAKKITVPVYICLGQRDVSPDPYMEPYYYNHSPEISLHILEKSGHCQSFASTRVEMWDRIQRWSYS